MLFINHRINTLEQLKKVPVENGIEVDIRYHNDELVLHHDPFGHHNNKPITLIQLLQNYKLQGPLILNIKTEGVEEYCIDLMKTYKITNWFFLDLSMPYFVIYSNKAFNNSIEGFTPANLAVRFSEYEPIEYALAFANKAKWVWIDCFHDLPLNINNYKLLKEANFKLCLVSPELQKHALHLIAKFKSKLAAMNITVDAVCTKRPDLWDKELSKTTLQQIQRDFP